MVQFVGVILTHDIRRQEEQMTFGQDVLFAAAARDVNQEDLHRGLYAPHINRNKRNHDCFLLTFDCGVEAMHDDKMNLHISSGGKRIFDSPCRVFPKSCF